MKRIYHFMYAFLNKNQNPKRSKTNKRNKQTKEYNQN